MPFRWGLSGPEKTPLYGNHFPESTPRPAFRAAAAAARGRFLRSKWILL
jgi:hypothetical protein